MTPEKKIQDAILRFLKNIGIMAWHNRNGATFDPVRKIYRRNTTKKGISDIIGILNDGTFLAIEVKTPKGRVSKEQQQFIDEIKAVGGVAFVARSVDDVICELNPFHE